MRISLYRRYRPQKFSEVAGQSSAVDVLAKSLERSLVGHAYLFSGPRGCGKTTAARLLAKALNCLSPVGFEPCDQCKNCLAITAGESLDVIEIDGASNNGVDEVRELKTHVTLAPFSSRYKVYIIDEVHMLSIAAFNALLKTLEEPPAHVVFILATTEPHKVPVTIRSRCQHIPFHRIGTQDINNRLIHVCSAEGIAASPDALWEIARQADGALRDALSMLEQISGLGKDEITLADVENTLGQASRSSIERWLSGWRSLSENSGSENKGLESFVELDRLLSGGASPQRFLEELFSLVRNLWLAAKWKDSLSALEASEQEKEYLKKEAPLWEPAALQSLMRFLAELMPQVRMGLRTDVLCGILLTRAANTPDAPTVRPSTSPAVSPAKPIRAPAPKPELLPVSSASPAPSTPPVSFAPPFEAPPQFLAPAASVEPEQQLEQPDTSAWKPYPEEKWSGTLRDMRENEFLLYCALLDVKPLIDEGRNNALVLDISGRYCYEVLKLDRHRLSLKNLAASDNASEVILRCEPHWTICDVSSAAPEPAQVYEPSRAKKPGKKPPTGEAGGFSMDFSSFGPAAGESSQSAQNSSNTSREPSRSAMGSDVPFAGLVQEAGRWLGGELIMVRAGDGGESKDDVVPDDAVGEN